MLPSSPKRCHCWISSSWRTAHPLARGLVHLPADDLSKGQHRNLYPTELELHESSKECLEMGHVFNTIQRDTGIWWAGWPGCKISCMLRTAPHNRLSRLKILIVIPLKKKCSSAWEIFYTRDSRQNQLHNQQVKEVSNPKSVRKPPVPPYAFGGSYREGDLTG